MKTLLDSLMLEVSLRPDLGRLLSAMLISSGMILLALLVARLLRQRSAASRNIVWRIVISALLMLAFWQLMPRYAPPMTVHVELMEPVLVADPQPLILPSLPPPAWWEYALSTVDQRAHQVWLAVAAFMVCLRMLGAASGLRRLFKRSRLATPEQQKHCDDLSNQLGMQQRAICHLSAGISSPLLTGFWQARIWLPEEAKTGRRSDFRRCSSMSWRTCGGVILAGRC
jgi:beta-lactamase regulating signal transducer with metallopeptidase domain